jgi:hypothetical protein
MKHERVGYTLLIYSRHNAHYILCSIPDQCRLCGNWCKHIEQIEKVEYQNRSAVFRFL